MNWRTEADVRGRMLVVDLFEQVLDIALYAVLGHRCQDRLNRFRLREPVKLLATMHTGQLQDQCEADCRGCLHNRLHVVCLQRSDARSHVVEVIEKGRSVLATIFSFHICNDLRLVLLPCADIGRCLTND